MTRLRENIGRKLTLISAPAGFGKSTLLSEWIHSSDLRAVWISLDEGDSDPVHFLTYLINALQSIDTSVGASTLALLQSPQLPPIETLLTILINDITTISDEFVCVLDDYHLVDVQIIRDILEFLIGHLPSQMHLVIASRADPNLPLARLRSKNQLSEFRATDLSFTATETTEFFNNIMALNLSNDNISRIESRTEGWITGLQLAAISMQDRDDIPSFISSFTGNDRHVVDYLVEEVLSRQPKHIQKFLIQTSILKRLAAPLCDNVMGESGSQAILNQLESTGLFIVPLDNERRWYRYLHLFADILHQLLHNNTLESDKHGYSTPTELHTRASEWYESNDLELEAFQHAAASNDIARTERLILGKMAPLYIRGEATPILDWLDSISSDILDSRPSLWVIHAWAQMFSGNGGAVEQSLQFAEAAISKLEANDTITDLNGQIESMRGLSGIMTHDPDTIISHSQRALELLDPKNLTVRTASNFALGYAYQIQGNLEAAMQSHTQVISMDQSFGSNIYSTGAALGLGQLNEKMANLHLAHNNYEFALDRMAESPDMMACEAHVGMTRVYYQWNDLAQANQHSKKPAEFLRYNDIVDTTATAGIINSRLKLAMGNIPGAQKLLDEADAFAKKYNFDHLTADLARVQVRILLQEQKFGKARELAQDLGGPLSLARVLLLQGDFGAAQKLVEPLQYEVKDGISAEDRLRQLVLLALIYHGADNPEASYETLQMALNVSEPEGYIRLYLDEGPLMQKLLRDFHEKQPNTSAKYIKQLLQAFRLEKMGPMDTSEHLSKRELEVLEYIAAGLSNQKISEALFVSMSTVKTHLRNIYTKLEVHSRTAALVKAKDLGLL